MEELARAVFKAWFVDFEPVKAKAAGATAFPGMPPETFATLPNALKDSPLGPVPEGWEINSLIKVATFLNGVALQKFPARGVENNLPVIKIAEMRKGSTVGADRASADIPPQYIVADGDLLFSWSGTLEARIWHGGAGALNQHLFKVTSQRFPKWFFHHWILRHLPDFRAIASSKATTMGHIQRKHLEAAMTVVPPEDFLRCANLVLDPPTALAHQLCIESKRLAALRDYLLPRLLSGQVRVRAGEAL